MMLATEVLCHKEPARSKHRGILRSMAPTTGLWMPELNESDHETSHFITHLKGLHIIYLYHFNIFVELNMKEDILGGDTMISPPIEWY